MQRDVLLGYARLMRPANLPTAAADILAGAAIAGAITSTFQLLSPLILLTTSSICLYAGGVVLNDVFDLLIDRTERPERPIPSGLIKRQFAAFFGSALLFAGILLAFSTSSTSGFLALLLAGFIVLYDGIAKKHGFLGPLTMGLCRGLNLLLGMSVLSLTQWEIGLVPVAYIFAITLISRGEVHGDNKNHLLYAAILYALVIAAIVFITPDLQDNFLQVALFLIAFAFMIYRPLLNAFQVNSPGNIKKAVISGVLGLVLMDAALASAFAPWWFGLLVVLLLPLSIGLSKVFSVT
jgi:4-hydroxybenzoate polyprenyltransferase